MTVVIAYDGKERTYLLAMVPWRDLLFLRCFYEQKVRLGLLRNQPIFATKGKIVSRMAAKWAMLPHVFIKDYIVLNHVLYLVHSRFSI